MPELCLVMFLIGCGYILYTVIMRFFNPQISVPFQIPTPQKLNLIWGFAFYGYAFDLLLHNDFTKTIVFILSALLLLYALFLTYYRHFFCGGFCPLQNLIKKFLSNSSEFPSQLTITQALKVLGINSSEQSDKDFIEKQYQKITLTLQKRQFLTSEIKKIISSAYQTLSEQNEKRQS